MLYKNGVKYELTQKDRNDLLAVIRKFPVSIVYVPEKVNYVKEDGKEKRRFPPGVDIDLKNTVVDDKGNTNEFVWCENVSMRDKKLVYYPTSRHFNPVNVFTEKDIELVWFLYNCVPVIRGGKAATPNGIHEFEFSVPFLSQKSRVEYTQKLSQAQTIVSGDEKTLPEKKLNEIANALFVPQADKLERIELQSALIDLLEKGSSKYNKEQILDRFFELTEDSDLKKVSSLVNQGFDKGVLSLDENSRQIKLKVDDKEEKIGKKVPVTEDPKDWAIKALLGDESNLQFLELALS